MRMKRLLSILLACLLLTGLFSGLRIRGYAAETVTYLDADGNPQTANLKARVSDDSNTLSNGFWLAEGSVSPVALTVSGSDVNLVLADGCALSANCIRLTQGNKLTVWAQSADEATVGSIRIADQTMGGDYAGIGGYVYGSTHYNAGTLVVNGGKLTVEGYGNVAIGGVQYYISSSDSLEETDGGSITINGGFVTAVSNTNDAAIGGKNSVVTINSGVVNATGSPGIGGLNSTVSIRGGTVTATGLCKAAGIGGAQVKAAASVTISGGTVIATGDDDAAGIGGGDRAAGTVTISGGNVTATSGTYGASIGGGDSGFGTVTVTGGSVKCNGGKNSVGIGGGNGAFCDVKLLGGQVDATDLFIGSGEKYRYGGDVLLGWTNHTDCYKAMRYRGILNRVDGQYFLPRLNHNRVEDLQAFSDNNYNGTLIPCVYTVTFDGSGAEGQMDALYTNPVDSPITLPACGFTAPEGMRFDCWRIDGTDYQPGETYHPMADTVIQAIWETPEAVSSISVTTGQDLEQLFVGTEFTAGATVLPKNAITKVVTWSSDDTSVATVNSSGRVVCRAIGTTNIRATATDGSGVFGLLPISVKPTPVSSVTVQLLNLTMRVGGTQTASARVEPSDATDPRVAWRSSDESVATVDESGRISALAVGTVEITATALDGSGAAGTAVLHVLSTDAKPVSYLDADGVMQTAQNVIPVSDTLWTEGWYMAEGDFVLSARAQVSGDVHLILTDGCTLTVQGGISVNASDNASLTVYAQSVGDGMGRLTASSSTNSLAGIGGDYGQSSGLITINGGFVEGSTFLNAAGIGGGRKGSGTVVIHGGNVTGICHSQGGAGIGGGMNSNGDVTITGGIVTASGGTESAAIGGGGSYAYGSVTITGGQVTANVNNYLGTGIGGGCKAGGTVSLSWTDRQNDSITAASYVGDVTLKKAFAYQDSGETVSLPIADGKTLLPLEGPLTVTYRVVNGTWADGTTDPITELVADGAQPANVPTGMLPDSGYGLCAWDIDPNGRTITEHTTFTWSCYHYTITFDTGGIGTAPDPMQSAWSGGSGNGDPDKDWFDTAAYAEPGCDDDNYVPYEVYDPNKGNVRWFLDPNDETTGVAPWDFLDHDVTVYCKWTQGTKLVDEVDLSVSVQAGDPIPELFGNPADFGLSIPDGADYEITWADWTDENGNIPGPNFEPGQTYRLRVVLSTGDPDSTVFFKGHNSAQTAGGTLDTSKAYTLSVTGRVDSCDIDYIDASSTAIELICTVPVIPGEQQYFVGHSLTLKDDIGINFIVNLGSADPADAEVTFRRTVEQANDDPVELTETVRLSDAEQITTGTFAGCYKVSAHVAAKEMTELVHATLTLGGVAVKQNQYAVLDYARIILADTAHATYSAELYELAKAMLIYGAQSQRIFGYKTWNPADDGLSYALTVPSGLTQNAMPELDAFGLSFLGSSLLLESRTVHRLYFRIADPVKYAASIVRLGCDELVWHGKTGDTYVYCEIADIPAKNILDTFTLTFTNGTETTEASVSVQDYIRAALSLNNDTLTDTVAALYDYCRAADAYFRSVQP